MDISTKTYNNLYCKKWRLKHKKERKLYNAKLHLKNKEKNNLRRKQHYIEHKEERKLYDKHRRQVHKKAIQLQSSRYRNKRYKKNSEYRLICLSRNRINWAIKSQGVKKCLHTIEGLGCTKKFFQTYIESLFKPGMTLENNGNTKWTACFTVPTSSFARITEAPPFCRRLWRWCLSYCPRYFRLCGYQTDNRSSCHGLPSSDRRPP